MHLFSRSGFALAAVVTLALLTAACGDNEPEQRKAFITFLQTRIVDKPGVHVPKLTDDELGRFGPYAAHYNVIRDFTSNPEMEGIGKQVGQVTQRVRLTSVRGLVYNRPTFRS